MADEKGLKSSYELAMERLRKSDEDAGITHRPLTEADKAAIAEIRSFYTAKLAEQELLHQSRMRKSTDSANQARFEELLASFQPGS
jgi:hypothetical protein